MPHFHYQGTDKDNGPTEGVIEAENRYVAVARLLHDGMHITEIQELTEESPPGEAGEQPKTESTRLRDDEFIAVADGMTEIVRGGLPLVSGLRALAIELPSRRVRRALETISDRLEQGVAVDEAVGGQIGNVPRHFRVLLQASLQTGRATELLEHYLHFARSSLDVRRRSLLAMTYPLLLLLLTTTVISGMLRFVVPKFKDLLDGFYLDVPPLTLLAIDLSDAMAGWRMLIPPLVIGLFITTWIAFGWLAGATQRKWLYHVPAIGRMIRLAAASRLCHLLAIGIAHEVPFPEALRSAGTGAGDAYIRRATHGMATDIERGVTPGRAATDHRMVPEVAHVFEWDGHDEGFSDVLWATGDICAIQSRGQSRLIGVLVQPLCIFGIAVAVSLIVFALMLPMINLMNAIS